MSPPDSLQRLKELFDSFDKAKAGNLSVQELAHFADEGNELHEFLVAADVNEDGVITRQEWDSHVTSWLDEHEDKAEAILTAAGGVTDEALTQKRHKLRSKRQVAPAWDNAKSDGEEEGISWFGVPIISSNQDHSFKQEDRCVPVGQKMEVMVNGSCFLCEVAACEMDKDYPYLLSFPAGDLKQKRCMIDVVSGRIIAPLWTRHKAPFHFVDDEEEADPSELLAAVAAREAIATPKIVSLVRRARQSFQQEPALLELSLSGQSKVAIFGDIHGNFQGFKCLLMQLAKDAGQEKSESQILSEPPSEKVLFLGDLVDRGDANVDVLLTVLAWKVQFPDRVFVLRGNHEDENINCRYGFDKECKERFGNDAGKIIYRQMNNMFNYLPVAAQVADCFCCHGGLGPSISSLDEVRRLDAMKPVSLEAHPETPEEKTMLDLLWADPCEDVDAQVDEHGFATNAGREIAHVWNEAATTRFLEKSGLKLIIRGHECETAGYLYNHSRQVLTIFSSPGYSEGNDGAAATMGAEGAEGLSFTRVNAKYQPAGRRSIAEDRDRGQKKVKPRSVCQAGCVCS
ncbi:unnamed protein product [Effrenium voratum]|nr:unnamed protein product [Effrenium voratum]